MNERLKKIRQALGYSQVELAKRLNCKSNLISMWEKGSQSIPDVRIYQICKEFGVRREYLVDGVGEMFETEEPPTAEELLEQAAALLFNELSEKGRQAVLRVMERELGRLGNAEEPE